MAEPPTSRADTGDVAEAIATFEQFIQSNPPQHLREIAAGEIRSLRTLRDRPKTTRLPQPFPRDPADQMIVAAGRIHDYPIATADDKILNYVHVQTVSIG